MLKEKFKQNISWIIFVIALWTLMIRQIMEMMSIVPNFYSISNEYGDKIMWFGISLLAIVIICNKPRLLEVIACLWAVVTVLISDNTMMLILVFLIIAASNFDIIGIVKAWILPVSIAMVLSIVLYPILYMLGNPVAIDLYGRETFFFNHPNSFGLWFSFWILGIVYLARERMSRWGMIMLLAVSAVFLVRFPESKTSALVLVAGIMLFLLEKVNWETCKIALYSIPIICILVTFVLTAIYYLGILPCDQKIFHRTFSMRFQDAAVNLTECPLNLWGQKVYHLGQDMYLYGVLRPKVAMDNGIVAALIYYGLILGTLLVALFVISIFFQAKAEDERHRLQAILLTITFVMGMMEWPAWYGTIGFPMFFLGDWIRNNDKKKPEIT